MTLSDAGPRVGGTIRFEGRNWKVTEVSDYTDEKGYESREWCCETGDTEAYLLREPTKSGKPRWFFTRWIEPGDVELEGGGRVPSWRANQPSPPAPKSLRYDGQTFRFDDATEGLYDHEGDEKVSKLTWEYWDAAGKRNVAVELWGDDGASDFYCGAYIDPEDVELLGAAELPDFGKLLPDGQNPFWRALVFTPLWYLLPMFCFDMPFDESLPCGLAISFLHTLASLELPPLYLGTAAALAGGLGLLFGRFHPLSTLFGAAGVAAAPALFVSLTRRGPVEDPVQICFPAFLAVAFPAGAWGYYQYYAHAPAPHTLIQLLLALAPAGIGGTASVLIAWGMLS